MTPEPKTPEPLTPEPGNAPTDGGRIIDGKAIARGIRRAIKDELTLWPHPRPPGLGVVLVGEDPASRIYVDKKKKTCARLGIHSVETTLPTDVTEGEVLAAIEAFNTDPLIDGILVQLPLPDAMDANRVLDHVDADKDVDGFHPVNMGRLVLGREGIRPCTPLGVIRLLDTIAFPYEGRHAVVVGRSNIVGKPQAHLLLQRHMTVTLCHSRTRDLADHVRRADLVVAAVGRPGLVKGDWIRPGAVVIDVGTNRTPDGLVGDVEFDAARQRAAAITPVPGGVGPMTIAMLMENTLTLARRHLTSPEA